MREIWTDRLNDLKWLPPIRYKGESTTTQTRTIPEQTGAEAGLQRNAVNYAGQASNTAGGLLNQGNYLTNNLNNVITPYTTNATNITSGYSNLLGGNLPSQYATNRQQALNADLSGTVGNAINNLGSRGILNSSVTGSALNNIGQNASNTLASNYANDLSNYSGLLGNASANNTGNLSNYESLLSSLLGNANQMAGVGNNLYNTMYSGRMGSAGTQTTQDTGGNNGVAGMVGTLGSAMICFAGGTKILTPTGDKNIEDIALGDLVCSLDYDDYVCTRIVTKVKPPHFSHVLEVITDLGLVKPTLSQRFLTDKGFEYIQDIKGGILTIDGNTNIQSIEQGDTELVYDFTVEGRNIFFANGLVAEGLD